MKTLTALVVSLGFTGLISAQTLSNYQFTVTSQNPNAYFKLDGTLEDSVTPSQVLTVNGLTGAFFYDAYRNSTNAYAFFAAPDALTIPSDVINGGGATTNDAATGVGSISLIFHSLNTWTTTGQRWLFSQGDSSANGNGLGLFFENNTTTNGGQSDLKLRVGNGTTSILASNAIAFSSWYYFAMTWDESRNAGEVIWYLGKLGGPLISGVINLNDDAVVGDNGNFILGNAEDLNSGFRDSGNTDGRLDEVAFWTRELVASEVTNQFTKLPNYNYPTNGTYQQIVSGQKPVYYFKLDNSLVDSVSGTYTVGANGVAGVFTNDLLGNPSGAYAFNGGDDALIATDIIPGGGVGPDPTTTGLSAANAGTFSFLFRMLADTNNTGQRYIFGQGTNSATANQLGLLLENTNSANGDPNSLKLRVGNGPTTTILQPTSIITNAWYYFAMTYDESRNNEEIHYYLGRVGGSLTSGIINIGNTAVVGDNGNFYIGNRITLNNGFRAPGPGLFDEFAVWKGELQIEEINAQFASITNGAAIPAPSLQISLAPPNVILSWPSATPSNYQLEATPSLVTPTTWTNAGSPATVGSSYVVTNPLTPSAQFFRLHKP